MTGPQMTGPQMTLAGVRVLEASRLVPGALVGWWLAALGAEVVKLEEPGRGDYMRSIPPYLGGRGLLHQVIDRGKKSVALDLQHESGRAEFRGLCRSADVVIDGYRPGVPLRLGIDYRAIRADCPKLVVCSVTGFGQSGPLADLASHGFTIDTLAGVSPVVENADGSFTLAWESSSPIGIETGALSAVVAILAALIGVGTTGNGAWIDLSMWDAAVHSNRFAMTWALAGCGPLKMHDQGPLYGAYRCLDDKAIWFAALELKFWRRFCQAVDRSDLASRWNGQGELGFGTEALRAELRAIFRSRTSTEWEALFRASDVPGNRVCSAEDVAVHPHFTARKMTDPSAAAEDVPVVGAAPVWMEAGARLGHGLAPAPEIGAHTHEINSSASLPARTIFNSKGCTR